MDERNTAEYEARIAELTGEVAALHASLRHSGAALHFVNWLRDRRRRVAPEGSRRHRAFRLLLRSLQIWRREGTRSISRRLIGRIRRRLGLPPRLAAPSNLDEAAREYYHAWLRQHDPSPAELERQRGEVATWNDRPLFSLLAPIFNTPPAILRETIESVRAQSYDRWELCLADGRSTDPATCEELTRLAQVDERIRVLSLPENRGISGNTNAALEMARGEFIALLDHDDLLTPDALYEMAARLRHEPDLDLLYSDKDSLTHDDGQRLRPLLKPGWSPTLMLSANYLTHFNVIRTELARRVGGLDPRTDGAQDWDFFLRLSEHSSRIAHVPRVLYHWRIWPRSTASGIAAKPYALKAQALSVGEHLRRTTGREWDMKFDSLGCLRARPRWPEGTPSISAIVSVRHGGTRSKRLVERLRAAGCEVIVAEWDERRWPRLNEAAKRATGDAILFVDEQVEPVGRDWLRELRDCLAIPAVGAVTPRFERADGEWAGCGAAFAPGGVVRPLTFGQHEPCPGLFGAGMWCRDHLGGSAACLLVRANLFRELGGFDESFEREGADYDLGLRLNRRGARVVATPFAAVRLAPGREQALCVTDRHDMALLAERFRQAYPGGDPFFHPALEAGKGVRFAATSGTINETEPSAVLDFTPEQIEQSLAVQRVHAGPLTLGSVQWFIPALHHAHYGGIHTILRLADHLRRTRGTRSRFAVIDDAPADGVRRAIAGAFPALVDSTVEVVRHPADVARLAESDVAIATRWQSAYHLLRFNRTRRKLYMVQDYEPLFHAAGAQSALAEATYRFGFQGLCNTPALREIYERDFGGTAVDFLPCVDTSLFRPSPRRDASCPLTAFFYGRPGSERNAFEIAVEAARLLKRRLGERVRIVSAGADWWPQDYGVGDIVENLGLLPVERTAELYRECDVGLVMMLTRHPSYLPFEFMASGCLTVTNRNPATAWLLRDGENCLLSDVSPSCIARTIERGLLDDDLREQITSVALDQIRRDHSDWDSQMERVARFMESGTAFGLALDRALPARHAS
jgi:GT2 family glycosyltransferase/glycosyltransferase involved in cell wall biosynthesis